MNTQNLVKPEVVENVENPVDRIMLAVGLAGLGGPGQMKKDLTENLSIHQAVIDFVNEHFVEGIDYGKGDPRSEKKSLLKPGAEKICKAFNTHPHWTVDKDMWEILGRPTNTAFFTCHIIHNVTGAIIGEGRGACTIGETHNGQPARDTNGSIKNEKKRAMVDAALDAFMLSERFTQDIDEIKSFIDEKKLLYEAVQKMRSGIKSDLTDSMFIQKVCSQTIHQKSISTRKQLEMVNEAVSLYDFDTGEKN